MAARPPSPRERGPRPTPRPGQGGQPTDARPAVVPPAGARRAALAPEPASTDRAAAPVVSAAPSASPAPGYLPSLDGLRAVSVLAVVAYHLGELSGGFLGVDVFFAISGFLITRLLLAEHERAGRIGLRAFWGRRFRRLLPALMLAIVFVMMGARLWLPEWRLGDIRWDALAALGYVANWRFVLSGQSYFQSGVVPSPLRHTWSLAIEEQYYLLWPLVVAGIARLRGLPLRRTIGAAAAAGAVVSAVWMAVAAGQGRDLSRLYYGTDTRAFALFAGAWLASWWDPAMAGGGRRVRRAQRRWAAAATVGLVAALAMFVLGATDRPGFYQGGFQAMAVLSVVLVAGAATGVGALNRALSVRPLVWIGRRSYGIYLWSWPVQIFASEGFGIEGYALDALVVGLSIALAALSHWLVEEPIRTGTRPAGLPARRERERRVPTAVLSFGAVGVVVAIVVVMAVGARPAPDYTSVSDQEALGQALAGGGGPVASTTAPPPVDEGPPGPFSTLPGTEADPAAKVDPTAPFGRPLKVMIAGDSVGWSLGWELPDGEPASIDLTDRAIIGCGLMPQEAKFIVGERDPEQYSDLCLEVDEAERRGLAWGPDVVLLWAGAWEVYDHELDGERLRVGSDAYAEVLDARIQQRVDWYRALGIPTVIAKVTCFGPNALRLGKERHDDERIAWVNERIDAAAARNRGWVRTIDPTDQLCDADGVALEETPTGLPLRDDGAHFDPRSAAWFWDAWLGGQLGAVMADVQAAKAAAAASSTTTTQAASVLGASTPPEVTGGG